MFEKVCDFPDLGTVMCEVNPFFYFVVDFVSLGFVLRFLFQIINEG
jgi:hypothetical protein